MPGTLIFGGTGSLGRKLIDRLLPDGKLSLSGKLVSGKVTVYSRDEAKHWAIANQLADHPNRKMLSFYVGDVRDPARIRDVLRQDRPHTVIIAAALKQVDTCELSPYESIQTNLLGTQNVVDAVNEISTTHMADQIKNVLFVSTDKACSPVNVYGMCKATSERIVTSQARTGLEHVRYLAVRYGNVLESRGSIIPLFKHQGMNSEFLTVTDPEMTRFLMTLDDSVDLIQHTLRNGKSGETWVPRLPAMKVGYLANIFAGRYGKPIKVIGLRPGEKQDEDLINASESVRTRQSDDSKHFIIGPAFNAGSGHPFVYSSKQDVMRQDELEGYLKHLGILDMPLDEFKGLTVEEIMTNRKE